MEAETDTEKVKMQVMGMGIGIEEMFEFKDTSSYDIKKHLERQKARFFRHGKFEKKHTFLLVYINCYGFEDGPKEEAFDANCTNIELGKQVSRTNQQFIVLNTIDKSQAIFPIEAELRQLIDYSENKCLVMCVYDTIH